jgi:hypothetical protein
MDLDAWFIKNCDQCVELLKNSTPIDTQRLHDSTQHNVVSNSDDFLIVDITQGGVSLLGIRRETDIKKDVNYAIHIERRYNHVTTNIPEMVNILTS